MRSSFRGSRQQYLPIYDVLFERRFKVLRIHSDSAIRSSTLHGAQTVKL